MRLPSPAAKIMARIAIPRRVFGVQHACWLRLSNLF